MQNWKSIIKLLQKSKELHTLCSCKRCRNERILVKKKKSGYYFPQMKNIKKATVMHLEKQQARIW